MNRIRDLFKQPGEKLIPYITAGFPSLDISIDLILAMESGGADMIELGIPFSDPLADGPVIQASSQIALRNGVTLPWILEQVTIIRKSSRIPLVLMGDINPILKYGYEKFISDCRQVGVDGLIVPNLPPEEAKEFVSLCRTKTISPILLVAPNTPGERIQKISAIAGDLIYCVAILGITGNKLSSEKSLTDYLSRVRKNSHAPFVVGFGVKTPEDVHRINQVSDGAVVGTSMIEKLQNSGNPVKTAFDFVKKLKGVK